jgi:pimeloyl-ACP methyl ester carboxylesterase
MLPTIAFSQEQAKLLGSWQGALKVSGLELRMGFVISATTGEKLSAACFSIDQNNAELPVTAITFEKGEVKMTMPRAMAEYHGKLSADGKEIDGHLIQAGVKLPLTLNKVDKLATLVRPQEPKPPFLYKVEDITFENAKANVKLAGTLTIPEGKGPFPAVLLISGSGPQDRDETIFGHKPFMVIADYLCRRGVAVLRYDDRGVGKSTGAFLKATTFDFADDAQAGFAFLQGRREVDTKRIGLLGHSEGGIIAPLVASNNPEVAFIILLAGTGMSGEEIMYLQGRLIAAAMGAKPDDLNVGESIQRRLFQVAKAEAPSPELVKKLQTIMKEEIDKLPADSRALVMKTGLDAANAQLQAFAGPWLKAFMLHDPRPVLGKVKCPVLALNGEKDLQVPWKENLAEIDKALRDGGNSQVTLKSFPGLNHLFQTCTTGAPGEYGKIEESFNPEVLKVISAWIATHTNPNR